MVDNPLGVDANRVKVGALTGSMINPRASTRFEVSESAPTGRVSASDSLANSLAGHGLMDDDDSGFESEFYYVPSRPRASAPRALAPAMYPKDQRAPCLPPLPPPNPPPQGGKEATQLKLSCNQQRTRN